MRLFPLPIQPPAPKLGNGLRGKGSGKLDTLNSTGEPVHESALCKIERVVPLVLTATGDGFAEAARDAWSNKGHTALELCTAVGLGAALATLQARANFPKLALELGTAALTAATVSSITKQGMSGLRAVGEAWDSPLHLQENHHEIKEYFGGTLFHTALGFSGGMAGASLGRGIPVALNERAILRDMKNFHAESAEHSVRTATYSELTAKEMGLPFGLRRRVYHAGLMHDAGKLDMPLEILGKTDGKPFTPAQLEVLHQHPVDTLARLKNVGYKGELRPVPEDASMHHEWMNGQGYPFGLKGDQIPIPARAIPPADVFDAVTAGRAYMHGERMPLGQVKSLMDGGRGTHFDPQALDALWRIRMDKALKVMESGPHRAPLTRPELNQFRQTTLGRMLDVSNGLEATLQERTLAAKLMEIYSRPAI